MKGALDNSQQLLADGVRKHMEVELFVEEQIKARLTVKEELARLPSPEVLSRHQLGIWQQLD